MLTAVVPIFRMSGKLQNLKSWMRDLEELEIRVILVEDGGDPATLSELRQILDNLDSEKFDLITGEFGSPGAARNAGLELIHDGWVTFWDSDDLPNPKKFLEMTRMAELKNAEVGVGLYENVDSRQQNEHTRKGASGHSLFDIALNPGIWRWIFQRKRIGSTRFNSLRMGEDQIFLMSMEVYSDQISYSHEIVYKYFTNVEGQLTKSRESVLDLIKALPISLSLVRDSVGKQKNFNSLLFARQILTCLKRNQKDSKRYVFRFLLDQIRNHPRIILHILLVSIASFKTKKTIDQERRQLVSLTGGLGNQLFQLAAAIDLSTNGLVTAVSSLGKPRLNSESLSELQSFEFRNNVTFLKADNVSFFISKIAGYMLRSGIWPKKYEKSYFWRVVTKILSSIFISAHLRERVSVISAKSVGFENIDINLRKREIMIGYFQSSYWVMSARTLDQMKSMTLSSPGVEFTKLKSLSLSETPLVVHVRLGDYRNEPTFGLISKDYYANAINAHLAVKPINKIWVFSDEISAAKDLLPPEWHSRIRWIEEVDGSTAGTFEAMRLGSGYVIANSTFSWWAAMLSHAKNPLVVAPRPWFIGQPQPLGLIPSNWTSISR